MASPVKDPVCGMTVFEHAVKAKLVYQGQTYHFCSTLCKRIFDREPEKYIKSDEQINHH